MINRFTRVKGTQDFIDLTLFNFIITSAQEHLALYHFNQITTPIIEHTQLFIRSLGVETDVVSKQMFIITTKDEEEVCLRPEMTASTVRAFVDNGIATIPWKVFSWGPVFRYERPQKGRYREFNQINIEIIGSSVIEQDAQLIMMLDRFFHEKLMLSNYALLVNFLGCFEDRVAYRELLREFLNGVTGLCDVCMYRKDTNILRVFDCKNVQCQAIYQNAPYITDSLCKACAQEWKQLQEQLHMLSVSFSHKPTLVRGLDYYNKTVFEFVSKNLGAQDTFAGGGRYDQLVGQIGGKEDLPSVGAALGVERLLLLLEPQQNSLPIPQPAALYVIAPLAPEQRMLALLLADQLRASNLCVDVLLEGDSVKSMMRKANKLGAAYVLMIGQEEQAAKQVTIKNMVTGEQERVAQVDAVSYLKK